MAQSQTEHASHPVTVIRRGEIEHRDDPTQTREMGLISVEDLETGAYCVAEELLPQEYTGLECLERVNPLVGVFLRVEEDLLVRARAIDIANSNGDAETVGKLRYDGYEQYGAESAEEKADIRRHDPRYSHVILVEELRSKDDGETYEVRPVATITKTLQNSELQTQALILSSPEPIVRYKHQLTNGRFDGFIEPGDVSSVILELNNRERKWFQHFTNMNGSSAGVDPVIAETEAVAFRDGEGKPMPGEHFGVQFALAEILATEIARRQGVNTPIALMSRRVALTIGSLGTKFNKLNQYMYDPFVILPSGERGISYSLKHAHYFFGEVLRKPKRLERIQQIYPKFPSLTDDEMDDMLRNWFKLLDERIIDLPYLYFSDTENLAQSLDKILIKSRHESTGETVRIPEKALGQLVGPSIWDNEVVVSSYDAVDRAALVKHEMRGEIGAAIVQHLQKDSPIATLDIGCGPGYDLATLLETLESEGFSLGTQAAIDSSPKMVSAAGARGLNAEVGPAQDVLSAVKGKQFDLITSHLLLYHLGEEDITHFGRDILQAINPNGLLSITIPAKDRGEDGLLELVQRESLLRAQRMKAARPEENSEEEETARITAEEIAAEREVLDLMASHPQFWNTQRIAGEYAQTFATEDWISMISGNNTRDINGILYRLKPVHLNPNLYAGNAIHIVFRLEEVPND